jgi:TonB family protein
MCKLKVLTLLLFFCSGFVEAKCPHDEAIYCPIVKAPHVTELREGSVRVKYIVQESGLVSDVMVLENSGDPRWVKAVAKTVETWKYKKSTKSYEQEFEFNAVFGE